MKYYQRVAGKFETYKKMFHENPGFRCDLRTIIFTENKLTGEVCVEQQYWFRLIRRRFYSGKLAKKMMVRLYRQLCKESHGCDYGYQRSVTWSKFWVTMKVWG